MASRNCIARNIRPVLVFVLLAGLAVQGVAFVVTQLRARTELASGDATCPRLAEPYPHKLTWHPGDPIALQWVGEPCAPGTASGLPVTLTARLYGPFASDDAAFAFVDATCGAGVTSPSDIMRAAAADAPVLHTDTSATTEPTQALTLPPSLSPGIYAVVATATIHNPGIGSTGNGEMCFTLRITLR